MAAITPMNAFLFFNTNSSALPRASSGAMGVSFFLLIVFNYFILFSLGKCPISAISERKNKQNIVSLKIIWLFFAFKRIYILCFVLSFCPVVNMKRLSQ
jgi:hypothetical protein